MPTFIRNLNFVAAFTTLFAIAGWTPIANAQFKAIAGWDNQLFPSFVLSTASSEVPESQRNENILGDQRGVLGIEIEAIDDEAEIEVTVSGEPYFQTSQFKGKLPKAGETYRVLPIIRYDYRQLSENRQAIPVTVSFDVTVNGEAFDSQTKKMIVRSINDCPFVRIEGEYAYEMPANYAAYVNEQHPYVDKLLREALDIGIVESFEGYLNNDPNRAIREVYALWDLMVARDTRYSNITTTVKEVDSVGSQHIRLLEETINNNQANCVDGSVLFVSALRKIGIDAWLALEPGHCYMMFWTDREHNAFIALETTCMGDNDAELLDEVPEYLLDSVPENWRGNYSWASFVEAVLVGTDNLSTHEKEFVEGKTHRLIDVESARTAGILPIPFRGDDYFQAYDYSEYTAENFRDWAEAADEEADMSTETADDEQIADVDEDDNDDAWQDDEEVEAIDESISE
ncbi:MAG: hypothetical protein R3C03_20120 [Pirellulaceae bacterium]